MGFKEFFMASEVHGHPNWGGDRRKKLSHLIKLYSPNKVQKPFTGVNKIEPPKFKKQNYFSQK